MVKLRTYTISVVLTTLTFFSAPVYALDGGNELVCRSLFQGNPFGKFRQDGPVLLKMLSGVLGLKTFEELFDQMKPQDFESPEAFMHKSLELFDITVKVKGDLSVLKDAPRGVGVVAPHPHGLLDGQTMIDLIGHQRPDFKVFGTSDLSLLPILDDVLIAAEINEVKMIKEERARRNVVAVEKATDYLAQKGVLLGFPSGQISSASPISGPAIDPEWRVGLVNAVMNSQSDFLPVFIDGKNSTLFQLISKLPTKMDRIKWLGKLSKTLRNWGRMALYLREVLAQRGQTITVTIGEIIPYERIRVLTDLGVLGSPREVAQYLKEQAYKLSGDPELIQRVSSQGQQKEARVEDQRAMEDIAPQIPQGEVRGLIEQQVSDGEMKVLAEGNGIQTMFVSGQKIHPRLMQQIGILREERFRPAGEGSGLPMDLDRFDGHYYHMPIWDTEEQQIAGAYRVGLVADEIAKGQFSSIYSNQQFNYEPGFFSSFNGQGFVELGRSFVREEYSSKGGLLLLFSGLAEMLAARDELDHMFGPVSISGDYSALEQTLIAEFLYRYHRAPGPLVHKIHPKVGFPHQVRLSPEKLDAFFAENDSLAKFNKALKAIAGRELPKLLKSYLEFGAAIVCGRDELSGEIIGFDFDPTFKTLDGLIVVDVAGMPARRVGRFLSEKDGVKGTDRAKSMIELRTNRR